MLGGLYQLIGVKAIKTGPCQPQTDELVKHELRKYAVKVLN